MKGRRKIVLKYFRFFLLTICAITIIGLINKVYADDRRDGIDSFPESYRPYLIELQKKHPNWKFTSLYTNLDWTYVINNENVFGKNLVPKSYSDRWKNTDPDKYNVEVDSGWVDSSRRAVEYCMDPRNFLNEVRIFQFEGLSYDEKTNNIEGIEKVLYGTEFYNRIVEYVDSSGNNITMTSRYSDLILSAGINSKVSCYHLASRIKQEVGPFLSHSSISGRVPGFEGYYNFYNIGATSSAEPMGAIKKGLQYAKDGNGASQATKDKYLIPWNNKSKAITGGAIFIGSSYIHLGQDTVYLQKFHVTSNSGGQLFWHQYMTNVLAPYSESRLIYNGYANSGILNDSISFVIPVYNNMPRIPIESPNILESDFSLDDTQVYADVTNTLNVRTGPSTSYEVLTTVDRTEKMTRIAKGKQSGELWDKVRLSNGMIGYVFQSYLKEVPKKQIEQINVYIDNNKMNKGESKKLNVQVLPDEAKDNEVEYSSSNSGVASVDSNGNILAIRSGTTTITVKAKENDVHSSIDIEVYTPITDIQIGTQDLVLQEEDSYELKPVIIPTDASNPNIIYTSTDENIAEVNNVGFIKAVNGGKIKIILSAEDGNINKEINVMVVKKLLPDEVEFDESLKVNGIELTGWDIKNSKVSEVKKKINTNYKIEIYAHDGKLLQEDEIITTGSKVRLLDENDEMKMEYIIIIYGDVNGDGKINSSDLLVLQRHILEIEKLSGVFFKAGNINKNGKNPSSLDSLLIQRHILEIKLIEQ